MGMVKRLDTLDPAAPYDELGWLDEVVGGARVVAIGESAHYNREFYLLRHRLLRYLVERHGFTAYAMESGFVEGARAGAWVRGGDGEVGQVQAEGITSLMGLWTELRDQLLWMRGRGVGWYGIDTPGSNASPLPGVDAVLAYLAEADPDNPVDTGPRERIAAFAAPSPFSAPAALGTYLQLDQAARDEITAWLADLSARLTGHRLDYVRRTGPEAYSLAQRAMRLTAALDLMVRLVARGDQASMMLTRETSMA
ncbi:MAG: erythromycin esterase family protein, partial [Nonomuraea sp.]|nr:erythromycin esterase family protein [Nonomuraea sp.]